MAVEYLDNGNDDGTVLGQDSSEKIAFWGATPAVQPASGSQAAVTATLVTTVAATAVTTVAATAVTDIATTAAVTTAAHGWASGTIADSIPVRINQLIDDVMTYDGKINQLIADVMVYDGKLNQAVTDIGNLTTLTNQIRSELVTIGILKGSA